MDSTTNSQSNEKLEDDDLANHVVKDIFGKREPGRVDNPKISELFCDLLKEPRDTQRHLAVALIQKGTAFRKLPELKGDDYIRAGIAERCLDILLRRSLPFVESDILSLVEWQNGIELRAPYWNPLRVGTAKTISNFAKVNTFSDRAKEVLVKYCNHLLGATGNHDCQKYGKQIADAIDFHPDFPIVAGDKWGDEAIREIGMIDDPDSRRGWLQLLYHCRNTTGSKPSVAWNKKAIFLLSQIAPFCDFSDRISTWFSLVDIPADEETIEDDGSYPNPWSRRVDVWQMHKENEEILKGLVWCCAAKSIHELAPVIGALCQSAFRNISVIGHRAPRLGNACLYALGEFEGMGSLAQLAMLKVKIKNRSTQNQIAKALQVAAEREGVTTDELEEMSVPEYGLTEIGVLEETMGDFTARLSIVGSNSIELEWVKADGKIQKSIPAAVKSNFADELKELRATAKDIQKMLPAVRERIDGFYLQQRSWPFSIWRERYLDHPLVGFLARRLIWSLEKNGKTVSAIFHEGQFVDQHGKPVETPKDADEKTVVRLWHPLDSDTPDILAWRNWLEEHLVQQPFKQAHREIYPLTDAEENTETYSNRFAAHIIINPAIKY